MRHINRGPIKRRGYRIKCFHVVKNVLTVHNHYPLLCIRDNQKYGKCHGHTISINESYIMHYKKEIQFPQNCEQKDLTNCTIYDPIMWKYKQKLDRNMEYTMSTFGYVIYN